MMSNNTPILKDKSKLKRAARRTADTSFDRIYKYYFDPDKREELSKKEEELQERWEHIWKLSGDILITTEIIEKQMQQFGISKPIAYLDLKNARKLFGSASDQMKKAKREIMSEWLIKAMHKAFNDDEWRSFEKLALRYARVNGLDINDNSDRIAELLKQIKPHTIIITGDPKALQQEADQLMEGVEDTEDVDYQDVEDED